MYTTFTWKLPSLGQGQWNVLQKFGEAAGNYGRESARSEIQITLRGQGRMGYNCCKFQQENNLGKWNRNPGSRKLSISIDSGPLDPGTEMQFQYVMSFYGSGNWNDRQKIYFNFRVRVHSPGQCCFPLL